MRRRRVVVIALVGCLFWAITSAESCSKASQDLNKASQGLDALSATCAELIGNSDAEDKFAQAEADEANRSDQSTDQTKQDALDALHKRCAGSVNPNYQPYVDVQTDISGP